MIPLIFSALLFIIAIAFVSTYLFYEITENSDE